MSTSRTRIAALERQFRRQRRGPTPLVFVDAATAMNLVTGETEEFRWTEAEYELVSRTPLTETFRPALFPGLEINLPTE